MLAGASCTRNALKKKRTEILQLASSVNGRVREWCPNSARYIGTLQGVSRKSSITDSEQRHLFFPRQSQSELFALSPDSRFALPNRTNEGARMKIQLAEYAEVGDAARAIRLCAEMKKARIAPDVTVYNWLIHACAKQGLGNECLAFLDDMELSNIKPTIDTYNYVIYAQRWSKRFNLEDILDRMEKANIRPNTHTFHHIILRHTEAQNLEMCLQCFAEMSENNVLPSLKSAQAVIKLASQLGHARLALDIAHAFEASSVRKLETQDWVSVLSASTGCLFEQGVLSAWQKVVDQHHVTPDEGMCLEVLHTAARHGLTNLALHALQTIKTLGVPFQEFHLVPILEAFCTNKMIEDAFSIVNLMRSSGIPVQPESAIPILRCLRENIEEVDKAWGILEKMHAEGKVVDVISLNTIIQASTELQDLQRAVGVYKAFSTFGVKPSIETFNHILSGCISAGHKELGDKMLEELQRQDLTADTTTFERIILLCLTQTTYEDAFFYLEEMKGLGHRPPLSVYEALIKKCVVSGDTRWKIAMDELHECGYTASSQLQRFAASGGKIAGRARSDNQGSNSFSEVSLNYNDKDTQVDVVPPGSVQN